jgi:hypothetical protein
MSVPETSLTSDKLCVIDFKFSDPDLVHLPIVNGLFSYSRIHTQRKRDYVNLGYEDGPGRTYIYII